MKRKGVGVDDADFYLQWAHLEASEGDAFEARNILAKAQERGEAVDHAKINSALRSLEQEVERERRAAETPVVTRPRAAPSHDATSTLRRLLFKPFDHRLPRARLGTEQRGLSLRRASGL